MCSSDLVALGMPLDKTIAAFRSIDQSLARQAADDLLEWYALVSPTQWKLMREDYESNWLEDLSCVFSSCLTRLGVPVLQVSRPTHEHAPLPATIQALRTNPLYRANRSRLTYRDNGGELITTEDTAIIGSVYWIWLEKIADDGSASKIGRAHV